MVKKTFGSLTADVVKTYIFNVLPRMLCFFFFFFVFSFYRVCRKKKSFYHFTARFVKNIFVLAFYRACRKIFCRFTVLPGVS